MLWVSILNVHCIVIILIILLFFFPIYSIISYEERGLRLFITALCFKHITAVEL